MPNWRASGPVDGGPLRFDVLLFERFSNHCLANLVEPLRAANTVLRRPAYAWRILTPGDAGVASSSGLPVRPTASLRDRPGGDALFVVSSYGHREHATPLTARMLRAAAARYGMVAGLDTGAWLLATAGLLDGREATIHPDEWDAFAEGFPEVRAVRRRWVADRDRASAGGGAATFEMVLETITESYGAAAALEVSTLFMAGSEASRPAIRAGGDPLVARAVTVMEAAVEAPLPLSAVARAAGCGPRELSRRFRRAMGAAPGTVYRRTRLLAARRMLEAGGVTVAEVAARCGYADASAFARAFGREFGAPPRAFR